MQIHTTLVALFTLSLNSMLFGAWAPADPPPLYAGELKKNSRVKDIDDLDDILTVIAIDPGISIAVESSKSKKKFKIRWDEIRNEYWLYPAEAKVPRLPPDPADPGPGNVRCAAWSKNKWDHEHFMIQVDAMPTNEWEQPISSKWVYVFNEIGVNMVYDFVGADSRYLTEAEFSELLATIITFRQKCKEAVSEQRNLDLEKDFAGLQLRGGAAAPFGVAKGNDSDFGGLIVNCWVEESGKKSGIDIIWAFPGRDEKGKRKRSNASCSFQNERVDELIDFLAHQYTHPTNYYEKRQYHDYHRNGN